MVDREGAVQSVLSHLRSTIYGRAYALMFSSAVTSVLGLLYWTVAARLYSAQVLGVNAAMISTMMFLSFFAQLSLSGALPRFIPTAGRGTMRLILVSYGVGGVMSVAVSFCFVLGAGIWAPDLRSLVGSPGAAAWFLAATTAWTVFTLQDAVLTGLRRTVWVPIENTIFAATKVLLVVVLAVPLAGTGVYVAWTVPATLAIVPINLLIFRWFLPSHVSRHGDREPEGSVGQIGRYLAADFAGSLVGTASTALLPLIVLATSGPSASAYYYIAWTVAYSIMMFSLNMAISMSVEGGGQRSDVALATRRMLRLVVGLELPLVIFIVIFAPLILEIFGRSYSDEGAMLLRLLSLGVLPNGLNAVCLGVARARRQLFLLFGIQAGEAVSFVALALVCLPAFGIAGVGAAFLLGQAAVALVAFVTQLLPLLRDTGAGPTTEGGSLPQLTSAGAGAGPARPPE